MDPSAYMEVSYSRSIMNNKTARNTSRQFVLSSCDSFHETKFVNCSIIVPIYTDPVNRYLAMANNSKLLPLVISKPLYPLILLGV
jgi:hypothetical protein